MIILLAVVNLVSIPFRARNENQAEVGQSDESDASSVLEYTQRYRNLDQRLLEIDKDDITFLDLYSHCTA